MNLLDQNLKDIFIVYLIFINLICIVFYALDKAISKWPLFKKHNRISERKLLLLSFIGGWIGALLAQNLFRHKTKKKKFQFFFWAQGLLQISAIIVFKFLRIQNT